VKVRTQLVATARNSVIDWLRGEGGMGVILAMSVDSSHLLR